MSIIQGTTIESSLEQLVMAPLNHPELLPNLLPLILGALVIELYFGKYEQEELGWNTSVGNSVIWVTTGISLLMTAEPTGIERQATFFLVGLGAVVGYMNFFHKWSSTVAFVVSSAGLIYSLAYVLVVVVKTGMTVNETVLQAALIFIVGVNIVFKIIQSFETPRDTELGGFN